MTEAGTGAAVLLPGEAPVIHVGSFDVFVHADGDTTGGTFSLIETADPDPGSGPPLHIHRDAAESFYVLAGEYVMHIDGRDFRCPPSSFIYIPRGVPHTFRPLQRTVGSSTSTPRPRWSATSTNLQKRSGQASTGRASPRSPKGTRCSLSGPSLTPTSAEHERAGGERRSRVDSAAHHARTARCTIATGWLPSRATSLQ